MESSAAIAPPLRKVQVLDLAAEMRRCDQDPAYFIESYCWIYNAIEQDWVRFHLWPRQRETLQEIHENRLLVILKARQLGLTWLCLCYVLWLMLFRSASTALLFSLRDKEATHLLEYRLKGIYRRLPDWLKCKEVLKDDMHDWRLSNGSVAQAFPANAGDSYTGTIALVDEADLIPKLDRLLSSVRPTIADGGRMILLSRPDKARPNSTFKRLYRAARRGENDFCPLYLPWTARPDRDQAWYEKRRQESLTETGALDSLHEQYSATEDEALAPPTLNKRIPADWLKRQYRERKPVPAPDAVRDISGLLYYGHAPGGITCGADPAEGNPNSDDSAAFWVDNNTGEEIATFAGKLEPAQFANAVSRISAALGGCGVMVERNNHGHAVLMWLCEHAAPGVMVLKGRDGRPGWVSSTLGKTMMYDAATEQVKNAEVTFYTMDTYLQLAAIESATLRAPEGEADDRADAAALALAARTQPRTVTGAELW